jgi:ABC-type nitrate/sulfonate/bicarbonate transport system substrate-binding protein
MMMKTTKLLKVFLLAILTVLLVACGDDNDDASTAGGAEKTEIRSAIDTAAGGSFQIRAANANGDFSANGLEVKLSNFAYGIDTVNAILTQQADTGLAADYALLNSLNKGDFVVVSSLTGSDEDFNSVSLSEILAVKGIEKPEDIKGKKIGVAKGTVFEYHWAKYLEHYGIDEKDVKYVPYSTPDEAIVGMKKGDMDVVIGSGALIEKFKSIDGVHEIDRLSSVPELGVSSYLIVDRKFAEQNGEAIGQFILGIAKGIEFVEANPDETAEIAYKDLKIAKEDVLLDLKRQNYTLGFTQEDYDHLSKMKTYLVERGILDADYDLDAKLFLEPAKQVIADQVTYQ